MRCYSSEAKQISTAFLTTYVRIVWEKTRKDSKSKAIYDDVLAKFDTTWGGNNLLYLP